MFMMIARKTAIYLEFAYGIIEIAPRNRQLLRGAFVIFLRGDSF